VAVDCSFGMSPQSGLPHNNRTGDIDVFAVFQVMKQKGYGVDEMATILASQSGLAGISGGSGDVRDLSRAAATGDARAQLALDVFVDAVRRYVGAFLVRLGGVDVMTFSGGIGENSPGIRVAVCEGLATFGLELDTGRNEAAQGEATISTDASPARILVIPADEERIVARATAEVVAAR
jgi:acetate kinase